MLSGMKIIVFVILLPIFVLWNGNRVLADVQVGVTASLSGNWASLGQEIVRGATLASEEENAKLGSGLEKIVLQIEDSDEADSSLRLLSAYQRLRLRGVNLIIGPTGTPGALSLLPVIERERVLLIAPSVGIAEGICNQQGKLLNIQGPWEGATRQLVHELLRRPVSRIGILGSDLPYEKVQANTAEKEVSRLGVESVRVDVSATENDLRVELQRLLRASPDVIFLSVYNQLGLAAKQLRALGYRGRLATIQIDSSRLADADGALEGTLFAGLSDSSPEFRARYQARFGKQPDYPADYAYDAVKLLAEAMRTRDSTEPEAIAKILRERRFTGESGSFSFDSCGHAVRSPRLYRWEGSRPHPLAENS